VSLTQTEARAFRSFQRVPMFSLRLMYGKLVPFSPAPSRHLFHPSSCLDAAGSSQVLAITISFLVNPEEFAAGKHRFAA